ncbi:MAG: nucleoside phosphorylase [Nanoarchaeota archaeon]
MGFPKLKNKHLFEALFTPDEFVKYKKWDKKNFPSKIIITYDKKTIEHFKRKFKGKYKIIKIAGNPLLLHKNIGIIYPFGIGSPFAATLLEELIAMGGKEFINMGTAGGLVENGIFLCNKALRDEGTSHHYIADGIYSYPNKELTNKLKKYLIKSGLNFTVGPTWTIDAPYRETKKEVVHYRKKGILTVEMEASAIFAVAKLRGVKIASVFVVSDVLGNKKWNPQFHKLDLTKNLNKVLDVVIDCLLNF